MTEINRDLLKGRFQNGDRPDGADFTNLIDSCVNKASDGLSFDSDGNLGLLRGIRIGDSAATVAGGLRFNGGQLQVFTSGAWTNVGAGGGAGFVPVGGTAIAYTGGAVGIGAAFTAAAPPTFRLEVPLASTGVPLEQVRFGNVVCTNGTAAFGAFAVVAHQSHATNSNFAIRQSSTGAVHLNAPTGQVVSVRQGGTTVRFGISAAGNTIVGGESELAGAGTAILQVAGGAFKNDGNAAWAFTSDARVKEDVRDLDAGLAQLRQVRPVRYRYNGRAGTHAGLERVGVIGQEIEAIFPETVERVAASSAAEDDIEDLRVFNPSSLTFVLINAVKQLADKVDQLEKRLQANAVHD